MAKLVKQDVQLIAETLWDLIVSRVQTVCMEGRFLAAFFYHWPLAAECLVVMSLEL